MSYNYKVGKIRINSFLRRKGDVKSVSKVPTDLSFTFENAYRSFVAAIFVDIRNSTVLFSEYDDLQVSKVIRAFTSETIEILRQSDNFREIGIRGDCVYGIYTTPRVEDCYDIFLKSAYVNTFINMLNKTLTIHHLPNISVGIGVATSKELVVKAGRKNSGINSKVWIGEAVTTASNLSSLANKKSFKRILFSKKFYDTVIDTITSKSTESALSWFSEYTDEQYGTFYGGNIVINKFNNWVENGMK